MTLSAAVGTTGLLKARTLTKWIGYLLLASVATSGLIGWIGGTHGFDWSLAAVAGTAFGTVVLAGFTGALARATSIDVSATRDLADLTRQDQELRRRPAVLITQRIWDGAQASLNVVLVNAGLGPALRIKLLADYRSAAASGGSAEHPFMAAEAPPIELRISVTQLKPRQVALRSFSFSGTCEDMYGERHPIVDLTAGT